MRFSYRSHPILEKLEKRDLLNTQILPVDKGVADFLAEWNLNFKKIAEECSGNINFICNTFSKAITRNADKILTIEHILDHIEVERGCLIEGKGAVVYDITTRPGNKDAWDTTVFSFYENSLIAYCHTIYEAPSQWFVSKYIMDHYFPQADPYNDQRAAFNSGILNPVMSTILFKKFAEVETKELKGNSKIKFKNSKHKNDSNLSIQILDSTWFTDLVRKDGIAVEGYFKLQHYGPGNSLRKLIYIKDYEKAGYVRKAGITKLQ